ncbi:CBASS cGAMP synthase [Burkholderia aenigmatica]|uniref:CBASS cGAMP synthase n=1 Tax=Burkholderia aenigmatica TaxID=2015348 RepID=UPI003B43C79E
MLKLHRLLYSSVQSGTFAANIAVSPEQRRFLVSCKNKIRDHLRPAIEKVSTTVLGMDRQVTPRFRTQGSWAYGTCVHPCTLPPQEMDWDFGIYLPVTVWEENGPPIHMAKAYFMLVERLLKELCDDEGWTLDKSKGTCIRVNVSAWAHIDVPLYAASEAEFKKVYEVRVAATVRKSFAMDSADFAESVNLGDLVGQSWDEMEGIVLATRSGEWVASDPNDVAKWFLDRIEEHGPQLQRVCRFLKAWRDYRWDKKGPTSVSIMIAVAQNFEPVLSRDDLALERAALALAKAILADIREPGIDNGADDFNRLDANERLEASGLAQELADSLKHAREHSVVQAPRVIMILKGQLGDRLPNQPGWIDVDSSGDDIRRVPAVTVPPPVVGATSAG